ncbi:hypothetical protein [Sphingorhabdus sp. Alg231-15]|uniref:hypothetical protein n=1 Tax=Sphingorhabdus sp. Alg231-15 TaxID=1922222 RepID=UPI00307BA232
MEQRKLGNAGPTTVVVGLGCMGMSDVYGSAAGARFPESQLAHLDSERSAA